MLPPVPKRWYYTQSKGSRAQIFALVFRHGNLTTDFYSSRAETSMVSDLKVSLCAVQLRKVMLFNTKVISLMSLSKTSALSVARRRGDNIQCWQKFWIFYYLMENYSRVYCHCRKWVTRSSFLVGVCMKRQFWNILWSGVKTFWLVLGPFTYWTSPKRTSSTSWTKMICLVPLAKLINFARFFISLIFKSILEITI